MEKYKTQPGTNQPLDRKKFFKSMILVVFNQVILSSIGHFYIAQMRNYPNIRETPTFSRLLFDLIAFGIVYEYAFFYTHRLQHHKSLYRFSHKVHHSWTAPVALMASCSHPIDHIISHIFPFTLPYVLLAPTSASYLVVYTISIFTTVSDHSGYHLPFIHSPQFHDYHHLKFTECFGANGFLDKFHGTMNKFNDSIYRVRHRTLWSFKSAHELFPDELVGKMSRKKQ
jgi:methylsterol monooxygenase